MGSEDLAAALHLYRLGRLDEAEARCHEIVARDPGCGEAWDRLARIAERRGHLAQAEAHYQRAITALRAPAEAHNNLAVLLQRRGDLDGALEHYRRALALGLDHALLHSNLGCLLRERGQLQDSVDQLTRALAIDDALAHAHSNLGVALTLQGQIGQALPHLRRAVALQPDWDLAHSNLLFCLNYSDQPSAVEVTAQHLAFGRRHPEPASIDTGIEAEVEVDTDANIDIDAERPLRIGFVSPDLRQHSVSYFLEPIFGGYDRDAFQVTAYADVARPDEVTDRMRATVDRWRSIHGMTDADVARLVRADRIDILIDLAGHTTHNRLSLFATRAAPVQMTYLGYCNTTGLDAVDWRITDAWADPPGMTESLHSEQLLRLPRGFLCFQPRAGSPAPGPPPSRASGGITFGSFNLQAKISPTLLRLWAEVLDGVPGSRLCLKAPAFADAATRSLFQRRLAASPLGRHAVELLGPVAAERDHLAAYHGIDIALDTWPYGGTTTTCEALWMGVPVVTLAGTCHAARVGASLLTRLGEVDLVTTSARDYVAAAVALARDGDRLAALRGGLRARMVSSGLTDAAAFSRELGEALRRAWRIHCEKRRARRLPRPPGTTLAPLAGNLGVVVPDTLDQITPYVLAEQHDWFEDEITFVRSLLLRGERAIDIGANHGVYALTMAARVGFSGRVWAFEPSHAVAERLRASVAINGLPQASVIEAALSAHEGQGQLVAGAQSELSHLVAAGSRDAPDGGAGARATGARDQSRESVALFTLDGCRARLGIAQIAFVKIDAEGAESDIIDGGRDFFTSESPLVMFEVRHGATLNLDLLRRFQQLGYRSFRLIPGLGILAPHDDLHALDPFALNLFACKPDRAAGLELRGLLSTAAPAASAPSPSSAPGEASAWRAYLRAQLFAAPLWPRWAAFAAAMPADGVEQSYVQALNHYALSRRITDPPAARHAALENALRDIGACAARASPSAPSLPVLQTLARIALDAGQRATAVQALNQIVQRCAAAGDAQLDRPFLAVSPRFDDIAPGEQEDGDCNRDGAVIRWVTAAALEQRERLRAFSSFYTADDPATLACLETMATLGYQSAEMARRLALVNRRRRP